MEEQDAKDVVANEVVSDDAVEAQLEKQLDTIAPETRTESSPEKKTTEDKAEVTKTSEDTTSKKSEEVKEETTEAPKGYHDDPAWKRIIEERNASRAERDELKSKGGVSDEDKQSLADMKTVMESAEYVQLSMKNAGFTQETIDAKLKELGFEAPAAVTSDLDAVAKKFGFKSAEDLKPEEKTYLEEIIKASSAIVDSRLEPIKGRLSKADQETQQVEAGRSLVKDIKAQVEEEKILDYVKDVEPMIDKWLKENPKGLQPELKAHVEKETRKLSIERLRVGKQTIDRDGKKVNLRQNTSGAHSEAKPELKPADTDENAEANVETVLDNLGIY